MIEVRPFEGGGYLVKTEGGVHLVVRPLSRLFRLVEVPETNMRDCWRYWCFPSFAAAVLAADVWTPSPDSEPVGWSRSGGARQAYDLDE